MINNWFKDWFASGEYHNVYKHRDSKDVYAFWDTFSSKFNIKRNSKILDAACGPGRYSQFLTAKGLDVTGFDLSMPLLKIAEKKISETGSVPKLVRADIRDVCFRGSFDYILNMFTSFGYFESDEENFMFIDHAKNFMNENSVFVLDYLNDEYVKSNLVPSSQKSIDGKKILERRYIRNSRVEKEIEIEAGSESVKFLESVKLYSKEEMTDQIEHYGYNIIDIWGGYRGESFDKNTSSRLLILFTK